MVAWGRGREGELGNGSSQPGSATPVRVSGLSNVAQVVGGGYTALALLKDGTVRAWGSRATVMVGDGTMPEQWGVRPPPALAPIMCSHLRATGGSSPGVETLVGSLVTARAANVRLRTPWRCLGSMT